MPRASSRPRSCICPGCSGRRPCGAIRQPCSRSSGSTGTRSNSASRANAARSRPTEPGCSLPTGSSAISGRRPRSRPSTWRRCRGHLTTRPTTRRSSSWRRALPRWFFASRSGSQAPAPARPVEAPLPRSSPPYNRRLIRGGFVRRLMFSAFSLLAGACPAAAQPYDPGFFSGMRWRLVGPFRGGRALAATGVPGEPNHFYFGAVGGEVWETENAGRTWRPVFDGQPIASIGAIAVAPSNPRILYVGSGEADMRSDISHGNGVYRSADGGATWTSVGLAETRQIGRILVDPRDANLVFVAALGHAYGPNAQRGVFRSRDGGRSWARVLWKNEDTGAIDLAFEPGTPRPLSPALGQAGRPPWNVYPPSNGPGSGLYRSDDGGETWRPVRGNGFPSEGLGRIGIAFAPGDPRRVYAIVDAKEGGLYGSRDGGAS